MNVLGAVRMIHAFLPLLERSSAPVVVNVTSGLGSLTVAADPGPLSTLVIGCTFVQAALNVLTRPGGKVALPTRSNQLGNPGFACDELAQ